MNKREYLDLIGGPLVRLFKANTTDTANPADVNELHGLYFAALKDFGADTAARGMALLISEHKSAWWPTIAEVREYLQRGYAEIRTAAERSRMISGPKMDWNGVPVIRRRLFRGWLGRHPEYFDWPAEKQHQVESFVRMHCNLYAQRVASEGGADPFIELTAAEMQSAIDRYESQKYLRAKRGMTDDPPPVNFLQYLANDPPAHDPYQEPPTVAEIAAVDAIMAQWRTVRHTDRPTRTTGQPGRLRPSYVKNYPTGYEPVNPPMPPMPPMPAGEALI